MEGYVILFPGRHSKSFVQGPYFVAFPNLREALTNHVPIKTQARSCTILPNFVGCVYLHYLVLFSSSTAFSTGQRAVSGTQWEGLRAGSGDPGYGRA
jgi:Ribosomal protein S19